jgi:acyl-CoA thioesterase FadM
LTLSQNLATILAIPRSIRFQIIFDDNVEMHDDLDSLLLTHNPRFIQLLEEARQRVRTTGGISLAEMRNRLTLVADTDA